VKRMLRSGRFVVLLVPVVVMAVAIGAYGYWTATGVGSIPGNVSGLIAPSPTATNPFWGTVHVSWSTVTLDPAVPAVDPEVTFTVERKPWGGVSWTFVCGTGTTPKPYNVLSCDDSPPATDDYDYRVVAHLRSWTSSAAASVHALVDNVLPTSVLTFPGTGPYSVAGWNGGCSSAICGTAADTGGSALQSVRVSIQRGSGNYWNGASFSSAAQVWNLASGTASWSYAFPAANFPADGTYTVEVRATDNALNVQSPVTSRSFTFDTTPPAIGQSAIAATTGTSPVGFVKQGGGYQVYADASDASAVASVTANVSTVTTGQTAVPLPACVSACTVGGHTYGFKSALLTASTPLAQGAKTYTVGAADVIGNTSSPASFSVQVDNTGPSLATVIAATTGTSPQGFVKQGGTYRVYANASDLPSGAGNFSGVDLSTLVANVSTVTTGQTAVALTACGTCGPGSAYAYQSAQLTANAVLSEGNKLYSVSGSDNLGTSASSSGANVQVDNTGPSLATVIAATTGTSPQGFVKQGGTYRVYANASDLPAAAGTFSGLNASTLVANVSTVSAGQTAVALAACGGCGPASAYAYQSAQLTADAVLPEGNKLYSVSASDNLGTSASSSGANVQVDNTGPSISTVIAATTGTSPQGFVKQGGTYRVYANASDLPSGAGNFSGLNLATLLADVSTVSAGQTAVALTACGGCGPASAYAYQSAQLTADAVLSEGNKLYSVSASDNLGTSSTSSGANVQVDNTAPTVATVIANTTTNQPGWLRQGGGYRVYANVTELPAGPGASSGLNASSITANVSAVTTGQTAVALTTTGCPCTIGGTSYAYQSAALTASNPLTAGSKSYTVGAADNLGTSTSQGGSVTIDNTAPALSTLQMFDVDLDGRVDRVVATFDETLETYSAGTTGWTLANAPGGAGNTLASVAVASPVATLTLNEGNVNTASGTFTVALAANANGIRDLAGNQSSFAATAVADKAAPVPTAVTLTDVVTLGRVRRDDTLTVTYSEALDATTLCSTWANGSNQTVGGNGTVDVLVDENGTSDLLRVVDVGANCGGAGSFRFGQVNLAQNYVTADVTFTGNNGAQSLLAWNPTARSLTVTLGAGNGQLTNVPASAPVYTPDSGIRDLAGNAIVATAFTAPATSRF
jgi:hypothetical protein